MALSDHQTKQLRAKLSDKHVKSRDFNGITLSYVEGWHVISEANRIFGIDAWDRASLNCQCVWHGEEGGRYRCVYAVKVSITVRAGEAFVVREGTGKLNSRDVLHVLGKLFLKYGLPEHIRSDNGPEFITQAVRDWLGRMNVKTLYIEPGSPWENGYC